MWEIDSDGNAFNETTKQFISCGECGAGFAIFTTTGKKGLKILDFTLSKQRARNLICEIAAKLNSEGTK